MENTQKNNVETNTVDKKETKNNQVTARITPEKRVQLEEWIQNKGINQGMAVNMAIDLLMNQETETLKECDLTQEKGRVGGLTESINNIFQEIERKTNEQLQQLRLENDNFNQGLTKQVETLTDQLNQKEDIVISSKEMIDKQKQEITALSKEISAKDSDLDSKTKLIDSFKLNLEQFDTLKKENAEIKGLNKQLSSEHDEHIRIQTEFKNIQKELEEQKKMRKEDTITIKELEKQVATLIKDLEIENTKNAEREALIYELRAKNKRENIENGENIENINKNKEKRGN